MIRTTAVFSMLALLLGANPALAQEEDTQLWLVGFLRGNLADDVFLTIDTSYRWRDPAFGADQQTFRLTVEKALNSEVRVGGGLSFFQTGSRSEIRPHQQFRYTRGGLDLRSRLELRAFEGAEQVEVRVRGRVQYTLPLAERVKAISSVEWFGIIQPRRKANSAGTEQARGVIGVEYEINERLAIASSYMVQFTPRRGRPDAISHVPTLTLNARF